MTNFQPKAPVQLSPPLDTPITRAELLQCDGVQSERICIAIKGSVFDVSANTKSYGVGKPYHVLAGRDASRALGRMALSGPDLDPAVSWDYSVLSAKELRIMNDWYLFFKNRYQVVGRMSDLPALPEGVGSCKV